MAKKKTTGKQTLKALDAAARKKDLTEVEKFTHMLASVMETRKNRITDFKTADQLRNELIHVPDFMFQYAINAVGLPKRRHIEIIGGEGLGKTTLAFMIMGWCMKYCGSYGGIYIETENKPMPASRIRRALSTNPVEADEMCGKIITCSAHSLSEMEEKLDTVATTLRGERGVGKERVMLPIDVPLPVVVDSWSKLMSKKEEIGFFGYADNLSAENKKDRKSVGEGSNLGHASFAHGHARRLPYLLKKYNILLLYIHHQNAKISMTKGGSSFLPEDTAALYNKTHLGGKANDQNAALQLVVAPMGQVKTADGVVESTRNKLRVAKNSYGPVGRVIEYTVRMDNFLDTEEWLEPAITTADGMARMFADKRLLETTADGRLYTCRPLNLHGVTARELHDTVHGNPDVMTRLGAQMGFDGCDDIVAKIKKEMSEQAQQEEADES